MVDHRVVSRYIGGSEGAKYAKGNTSKTTCLTDWMVHVLGSGIEVCKPLPQWAPTADVDPEDPRVGQTFVYWDLLEGKATAEYFLAALELEAPSPPEGVVWSDEEWTEAAVDLLVTQECDALRSAKQAASRSPSRSRGQASRSETVSGTANWRHIDHLGWQTNPPSHPEGIPGWAKPVGCFRVNYPFQPPDSEEGLKKLPHRLTVWMGRIFFQRVPRGSARFERLAESLEIPESAEYLLAEVAVAGVKPDPVEDDDLQIYLLELDKGGECQTLEYKTLLEVIRNQSDDIAGALEEARDPQCEWLYWPRPGFPSIELDKLAPMGCVFTPLGEMATAIGSVSKGSDDATDTSQAKELRHLRKVLGLSPDEVKDAENTELAKKLLVATTEAMKNAADQGKTGHTRSVRPVPPESLRKDKHALTGATMPSATDQERLTLASKVLVPNPNLIRHPRTHKFCVGCNAKAIFRHLATEGEEVEDLILTDELLSVVKCATHNEDRCRGCGVYYHPALGMPAACPVKNCHKIFEPNADSFTRATPCCNLPFFVVEKEHRKDLQSASKEDEPEQVSTAKREFQEDSQVFAYLRRKGGRSVLEDLGYPCDTLAEAVDALIRIQQAPQTAFEVMQFPCEITPEFLGDQLVGRWLRRRYKNYSQLGKHVSQSQLMKAANDRPVTLEMVKAVREGKSKALPIETIDPEQILQMDFNSRKLCAMVWGENYLADPAVAFEMLRGETTAFSTEAIYFEKPEMVKKMMDSHQECYEHRLHATVRNPQAPALFHYEQVSGGVVRNLPCFHSEQYLRAIPVALTNQVLTTAVESAVESFIKGGEPKLEAIGTKEQEKEVKALQAAKKRLEKDLEEKQKKLDKANADVERRKKEIKANKQQQGGQEAEFQAPAPNKYPPGRLMPAPPPRDEQKSEKTSVHPDGLRLDGPLRPGRVSALDVVKLKIMLPRDKTGCQVCWLHHTSEGCPEKDQEHFCSYAHPDEAKLIPEKYWSPEWLAMFLHHGGHKDREGQLSVKKVQTLMSAGTALRASVLNGPAFREAMESQVLTALTQIQKPNAATASSKEIQEGGSKIIVNEIWGRKGPFPFSTNSGIPVESVKHCMLGERDGILQGNLYELGDAISKIEGFEENKCVIKCLAGGLQPRKEISAACLGRQADSLLLRQMVDKLLEIDPRSTPEGSELASLLSKAASLSEGKPCDPQILRVISPGWLEHTNVLWIDGLGKDEQLTYTLNISHGKVGANNSEERYGRKGGKPGSKLLERRWAPEAISSPVVAVVVVPQPGQALDHANLLDLGQHSSLMDLQEKLGRMVMTGTAQVILQARGSPEVRKGLAKAKPHLRKDRALKRHETETAFRDLWKFEKELHSFPELTAQGGRGTEGEDEHELSTPLEELTRSLQDPKSEVGHSAPPQPPPAYQEEWREGLVREWEAQHEQILLASEKKRGAKKRGSLSSVEMAEIWRTHYLPKLQEEALKKEKKGTARTLTFAACFYNAWLRQATKEQGSKENPARAALEEITAAVRREFFGPQASALPEWDSIFQEFGDVLPEPHLKLLKELVTEGHDPLFSDIRKGRGKQATENEELKQVLRKLLEDQVTELLATRALVFGTWEPDIKETLEEAGVMVSGIVTPPKNHDDGSAKLDDWLQQVLRVCINCSDGPESVNRGIFSRDHTLQKTTSHGMLAQHYLAEERKYPDHPIRMAKLDIQAAFRWIATILRRVGLFASETEGFTAVYLTMIFGSKASPGVYDVIGEVISPALLLSERENTDECGPTHPEVARFVDDFLSIVAMFGNRGEDHMQRLHRLIITLFGEGGLNQDVGSKVSQRGLC